MVTVSLSESKSVSTFRTQGYPGSYSKGSKIGNLAAANVAGTKVFHAGTDTDADGNVIATGGRVLGVTAIAGDVRQAQAAAYQGLDKIDWPEGARLPGVPRVPCPCGRSRSI
eukprot:1194610-Prorocentrum_minimum.AAC.10